MVFCLLESWILRSAFYLHLFASTSFWICHWDLSFPSRTFINLLMICLWYIFIWIGTTDQLTNCFSGLNKKHNAIKFVYKISQTSIVFLGTEVSSQNNKFPRQIYCRGMEPQSFLHVDSQHPKLLKDSILYTQVLIIKRIYTTPNNFNQYFGEHK